MGTLYYGDNLDILWRYLKNETVDLVYLDPPFNSAQNYNAFFHEKDGTDAASQIGAGKRLTDKKGCAGRPSALLTNDARSSSQLAQHGAPGGP